MRLNKKIRFHSFSKRIETWNKVCVIMMELGKGDDILVEMKKRCLPAFVPVIVRF